MMARENNWFTFPPNPVANPELFKSHTHWRATQVGERFSVITWINERDGNAPHCFIGLLGNHGTESGLTAI